jgi:hypothetical protein
MVRTILRQAVKSYRSCSHARGRRYHRNRFRFGGGPRATRSSPSARGLSQRITDLPRTRHGLRHHDTRRPSEGARNDLEVPIPPGLPVKGVVLPHQLRTINCKARHSEKLCTVPRATLQAARPLKSPSLCSESHSRHCLVTAQGRRGAGRPVWRRYIEGNQVQPAAEYHRRARAVGGLRFGSRRRQTGFCALHGRLFLLRGALTPAPLHQALG